jgi:hypothetical protein
MMSYRSTLKFIPVEWFLANLQLLGFTFPSGLMVFGRVMARGLGNLAIHLVVTTFFPLWFEILTWFLVCECIVVSYRSSLNFVPIEWSWANLRTLAVSPFFNSLSNRLNITNYCLRSISSSLLKFTRFIQGHNIASTKRSHIPIKLDL